VVDDPAYAKVRNDLAAKLKVLADCKGKACAVPQSGGQPKAEKRNRKTRNVSVSGVTRTTEIPAPGQIRDQGSVTGKPFGAATIDLLATFGPNATMTADFSIDSKRGSAFGTVDMTYVFVDGKFIFDGTAEFTGGTGRYRGIKGKNLIAHDENTIDGQNGRVTLTGKVRF
jgi:hypothetical protein